MQSPPPFRWPCLVLGPSQIHTAVRVMLDIDLEDWGLQELMLHLQPDGSAALPYRDFVAFLEQEPLSPQLSSQAYGQRSPRRSPARGAPRTGCEMPPLPVPGRRGSATLSVTSGLAGGGVSEAVVRNALPEATFRLLRDKLEAKYASLREAFRAFDADRSGRLRTREFGAALNRQFGLGLSEAESDLLADRFDLDGNGTVAFPEFMKVMQSA